jgi:predicted nucleotidyltransferase
MDISQLANLAESAGRLAHDTSWYLFGSSSRQESRPRDIDVLIVYAHEDVDRARELSRWLEVNGPMPPIDLVLLSEEEARQSEFIKAESALLAWPGSV